MINETGTAASCVGAAVSAACTVWSFAAQVSDLLFGLPIQVVLACFFASFAARAFVGTTGFSRTVLMVFIYAALGAWTLPLVLHLSGLPTSVAAGVGVLISGGAQLPQVREWLVDTAKAIAQKWIGVKTGETKPGDQK